jgi:hypothetical protein
MSLSFQGGSGVISIKFTFMADTCLNNTNFNEIFAAEYIIYLLSLFKGKEMFKKSLHFCECVPKILNQVTTVIESGMDVMPLDATVWSWKFVQ